MARPLKVKKLSTTDSPHKAARRILRTRLKEYFAVWPDPDQKPTETQLHDLRISGKRLRYSAETFREFYPDRLSLLIELLKRGQDLLGEIQDCRSQRELLKNDLARLKKRRPQSAEARALARIIAEFEPQMAALHTQFEEIWRGLSAPKLRKSIRAMVSNPVEPKTPSVPVDETGDVPRAKPVVNIDHGNV
jgi:CHAD domain-containing protein